MEFISEGHTIVSEWEGNINVVRMPLGWYARKLVNGEWKYGGICSSTDEAVASLKASLA